MLNKQIIVQKSGIKNQLDSKKKNQECIVHKSRINCVAKKNQECIVQKSRKWVRETDQCQRCESY